jgi:hypothetical protein
MTDHSERLLGWSPALDRTRSEAERLGELEDREELRELIARYALRTALGVSCADLFTDDGAMAYQFPGADVHVTSGRAALDEGYGAMAQAPQADRPLPMLHNIVLEVDRDHAIGLSSNEVRVAQDGRSMVGSGVYADTFRREEGRWLFARREVTMFHWVALDEGWATAR